jgi:NAD(P)-dependent dehydrogenase (short-subunit alcohol dehydrogenase family)
VLLGGKSAVITGAGSGLGREIARSFAEQGADLVLVDRDAGAAEKVAGELGGRVGTSFLAVDVSDAEMVAAAFDADGPIERVDILVNSAGIREIAGPLELPVEEWNRVLDVNLNGTFYCCQAAARRMVAAGNGGAIINLAAVGGFVAFANRPAYTASKHAVVGLTRSLAVDLGPHGIRANAICPGLMKTPFTTAFFEDEEFVEKLPVTIPLGRPGEPPDIANAAVFLASPHSSFVSGVALPVDGAFLAGGTFDVRTTPTAFTKRMDVEVDGGETGA